MGQGHGGTPYRDINVVCLPSQQPIADKAANDIALRLSGDQQARYFSQSGRCIGECHKRHDDEL